MGDLLKTEVREYAESARLPVAEKHDSQGLCFVGDVTMRDFLSRYIQLQKGTVLDMDGNAIGKHDGASLYTTGQRHGFTVHKKSENRLIYFVVSTDVHANTISVSSDLADCASDGVTIEGFHWISGKQNIPLVCKIQSRYRELAIDATIDDENGVVTAAFGKKHIASPGQALVIYENDKCLGGGVISELVKGIKPQGKPWTLAHAKHVLRGLVPRQAAGFKTFAVCVAGM